MYIEPALKQAIENDYVYLFIFPLSLFQCFMMPTVSSSITSIEMISYLVSQCNYTLT